MAAREHTGPRAVAVTGVGGFIGRSLVETLLRRGLSVRGLLGPEDRGGQWPNDQVMTFRADISDLNTMGQLIDGADAVVHLAGPPSARDSFTEAAEYARVHVVGTAALLELAIAAGVRRFVYVSSAEVYGRPMTNPVAEDHRQEARSPYAAAKIGGERMAESFAHATDLEVVILRPFSIYGPGVSAGTLLGTILSQALTENQIVVRDLRPVRDYCYVTDLTEAIERACSIEIAGICTANIGTGIGTSVSELAQMVLHIIGRDISVIPADTGDRPEGGSTLDLIADCARARRNLAWEPTVSLRQGLERTVHALGRA